MSPPRDLWPDRQRNRAVTKSDCAKRQVAEIIRPEEGRLHSAMSSDLWSLRPAQYLPKLPFVLNYYFGAFFFNYSCPRVNCYDCMHLKTPEKSIKFEMICICLIV